MLYQAALVGIAILAAGCSRGPTFTRDVAPIVFTECSTCHRPGEAGPFPLLTYADVKGRARQIAEVTESRFMPPWMPEGGHLPFVGERRLTEAQIATIRRWVESGAPEGDARELPARPTFAEGWQLGTPDLVVNMPQAIEVAAEGADAFRTILVPLNLDRPRHVRAVEFRPGNPRAVHHAMIRLIHDGRANSAGRTAAAGMLTTEEGIVSPEGHVIGWAPGYTPNVAPEGMAWTLDAGTTLALELHVQPTGKPESVRGSVGLFFTGTAPVRAPLGLQLGSYAIDIPAGARDYAIEDRYELPVDVDLYSIYPHAHYLGKSVRVLATEPGGRERTLIAIPRWDFNWQNAYRYGEPVRLPRGTIVSMRLTYDNSAENPRNPSNPPVRVRYGGRSQDEMGNVWMQVAPVNAAESQTLRTHYERTSTERRITGLERLMAEPHGAALERDLGAMYLRVGRIDDGLRVLREAVRREPNEAIAHYNLGHAFTAKGDLPSAAAAFREAARIDPSYAEAFNNLGAVLRQAGDLPGAARAFRAAVAASPSYAPAHNNLGSVLRLGGDVRGAVAALETAVRIDPGYMDAHLNLGIAYQELNERALATRYLRRAIELDANSAEAHNALAWLLATAPDRTPASTAEAVTLAQRAAALTAGRDASALDTLAAAFAAAGDRGRAAAAAERALEVATASRQTALAHAIQRRLEMYRRQ